MKKSKHIQLVLVTAMLAACNSKQEAEWGESNKKVFLRSDTSAPYSRAYSPLLWYFAFRSFGMMNNGQYVKGGYHSSAIHPVSNFGNNTFKNNVHRGGFGASSFRTGS